MVRERNPLPYIFFTIILSSSVFAIKDIDIKLAFILASLFLFIFIKFLDRVTVIILIVYFFIGLFNIINYFNYTVIEGQICRIEEDKGNYYIGNIEGRKLYLFGELDGAKEGELYKVFGEFEKKRLFYNGTIGSINIDSFKKLDDDSLTRLLGIREKIYLKIQDKLGKRKAALISSISFGYTKYIDYEDKEDMGSLGLLHAIAVSGLHMGIVFYILKKLFGVKIALIISFVYVILTGCAVSTIRAYIMLLCLSMSIPLKRDYNSYASLALSGIIILLLKPYAIFTVGFLLSFTATLGIIVFNNKINKKLYKIPKFLRESLSISLSSQIFSLPILIYYFNEITLNSIIGNLILAPFITLIVIFGNLLTLTINLESCFSYLCFICYYIIKCMDKVSCIIRDFSLPNIFISKEMAVVYIAFLFAIYFYRKGYKYVLYYPIFVYMMVVISMYSLFPKISYLKEGVLMLSYRGNKQIIALKKNSDINYLREKYNVESVKRDPKEFMLTDKYHFINEDRNFKLQLDEKNYIFKVNYKKINSDYDIIDFTKGTFYKVIIINDKIIELY